MNSARLPREPVYGASLLTTHIYSKGCSHERRKFLPTWKNNDKNYIYLWNIVLFFIVKMWNKYMLRRSSGIQLA
uniref:Uncharacterized protein n=1 Tax=Heterorhabditis bacteriophora TaxID=37862 RepID=A0A1I7W6A0_HETBA